MSPVRRMTILVAVLAPMLAAFAFAGFALAAPPVARLASPGLAPQDLSGLPLDAGSAAACRPPLPLLVASRQDDQALLASFGAGFSAYAALLERR